MQKNTKGVLRPFAGVNLLCSGDVWQLPPPDGGFLGDIPCEYIQASRKFHPAPNIAHGQSLVWSGPSTGIQGMTELEICERTKDAWLRSVQDEFRTGTLTEETHAFLHGNPTMNPGSTLNGIARCLNAKCNNRITAATKKSSSMNNLQQVLLHLNVTNAKQNGRQGSWSLMTVMIRAFKRKDF